MKKQTAFRIQEEVIERLQAMAKANNVSTNKLVEDILTEATQNGNRDIEMKSFNTFDELEEYFLKNMNKWRLARKATKVIGKKILIFSK